MAFVTGISTSSAAAALRVRFRDGTWGPCTGNFRAGHLAEVARDDWRPLWQEKPSEG